MVESELVAQLERGRALGFLGPGPVEDHIRHAEAYVSVLADVEGRVVDLGAGGGAPGLILAVRRPDLELVLLDAMAKRCRFLEEAVAALGSTATVVEGRAEEVGRGPLRGSAAAVVARSFGPPATTAECAAPLLRVGGRCVVSEPPELRDRWDDAGLARLGMRRGPAHADPAGLQELHQVELCPDAYPRRNGVPAKRPLF